MAGKRGHDEGSIYERADGRWAASVSLGYGPDGKRQRKTVYGQTRKEVAAKLVELQKSAQSGLPPTNDRATVAQLMESWLTEAAKPTIRPKTYRSYEQLTRVHIVPALGRERVAKVDARRIQAFLREKQDSGLSPRTVQYLRAILRRAFAQAVKWDWVPRNVVALTEPPKQEKGEIPVFTPEQARALLDNFSGHRLGTLFTVQLGLGLRLGEALGLRWEDVALNTAQNGGMVSIKVQLQQLKGVHALVPPKSKTSRRTIGLPAFVARALTERKAVQDEDARYWEPEANPWGLVFTTYAGKPLGERNVRRDFQALLATAKLSRIRLHDLRHLCASLLLSQGVHPRVIMEILGHSNFSLTMNTYSHVMPANAHAAAQALDGLLNEQMDE